MLASGSLLAWSENRSLIAPSSLTLTIDGSLIVGKGEGEEGHVSEGGSMSIARA